jgi:hypothetical protein
MQLSSKRTARALIVHGLVALPQFLLGVGAEIADQIPLVDVGLVGRVARLDGHATIDHPLVVIVDGRHDGPRDVGRGHGLDDEGRRKALVHGRPEHVAHVVLDGVDVLEDEQGLVPDLLLEDVLHMQVEPRGKTDTQDKGGDKQAGDELSLNFQWLRNMHGPAWNQRPHQGTGGPWT